MCDYSIDQYATRLAENGQALIVHRFLSGSIGLADVAEVRRIGPPKTAYSRLERVRHWWGWLYFGDSAHNRKRPQDCTACNPQPCAVCVPPGATLVLHEIGAKMQGDYGVSCTERVTFVQTSLREYTYRDAVMFSNGRIMLLQYLTPGQMVTVYSVDVHSVDVHEDAAEFLGSAVVA